MSGPGDLVVPATLAPTPPDVAGPEWESEDWFLVVIPTYDERDNLPRIIPLVLAEDRRIEILVVDDNSPDGTGDVAAEIARTEPRVHLLRRAAKDGLGRAYLAGFRWGSRAQLSPALRNGRRPLATVPMICRPSSPRRGPRTSSSDPATSAAG